MTHRKALGANPESSEMVANVQPGSFYINVPLWENGEQGKGALTLESFVGLPQLIAAQCRAQHHTAGFSSHRSPRILHT